MLWLFKYSRARAGFLIYSYFKDSVFTAIFFPFSRLFLFFLGTYLLNNPSQYYSLSETLVAALIVIEAECGGWNSQSW